MNAIANSTAARIGGLVACANPWPPFKAAVILALGTAALLIAWKQALGGTNGPQLETIADTARNRGHSSVAAASGKVEANRDNRRHVAMVHGIGTQKSGNVPAWRTSYRLDPQRQTDLAQQIHASSSPLI
jgi:hypothetical protein